jgi:hypothetical protein
MCGPEARTFDANINPAARGCRLPSTPNGTSIVSSRAAIHRLLLPGAADLKEETDLGATSQSAQLVVRGRGSMPLAQQGAHFGRAGLGSSAAAFDGCQPARSAEPALSRRVLRPACSANRLLPLPRQSLEAAAGSSPGGGPPRPGCRGRGTPGRRTGSTASASSTSTPDTSGAPCAPPRPRPGRRSSSRPTAGGPPAPRRATQQARHGHVSPHRWWRTSGAASPSAPGRCGAYSLTVVARRGSSRRSAVAW